MENIGIDISKNTLDVKALPSGKSYQFTNDKKGVQKLYKTLSTMEIELIVLEPTGGYERLVHHELAQKGLNVALVNPKRVRAFANAINQLAKTDKIDAEVLARFGQLIKPPVRPIPDKTLTVLQAKLRRRNDLVNIKTAEYNRRAVAVDEVKEEITEHIKYLKNSIEKIEKEIYQELKKIPDIWKKVKRLREIPGVGKTLSMTLVLEVSELGKISNKEIAALVGLAPITKESGNFKGKKSIFGGRKGVRCALYMPIISAITHNTVIKSFYRKLISKGKLHKVAITASMRKFLVIINSIMKNGTKWDSNNIPNCS